MNLVVLYGFVGADPKIYKPNDKVKIAKVSIGTKMFVNNKEQIEWHNVEAFGKNAEFIESYVFKGDFILIQGFLSTSSFKDKSGAERKTYSVKVSTINKPKSGDAKPTGNTQQYHGNDDDIPY